MNSLKKFIFTKRFRKVWKLAALLTTRRGRIPFLSYEQALTFFDQLAAREDLALGYPREACYARTHLMCETAFEQGFLPKKAWAINQDRVWQLPQKGALENEMLFTMPSGEEIPFWAHTAMVLPVKTLTGVNHDLVFDPALFDGPVTLQEWGKAINASPHFLEIKPFGKPPTNFSGDYDTEHKTYQVMLGLGLKETALPRVTIKRYQPLEIVPRIVFASQYCRTQLFPALKQWPERRGKNWVSVDPSPSLTHSQSLLSDKKPLKPDIKG